MKEVFASIKKKCIKVIFSNCFLKKIVNTFVNAKYHYIINKKINNNSNSCFLIMTPRHGNLGDHAIAYSETLFLKEAGVCFIELTGYELDVMRNIGILSKMNGKPVIISGGGNLGDLWPDVEKTIEDVITSVPDSSVLIMPSSVHYSNSQESLKMKEQSARVFNNHRSLIVIARDRISFETLNKMYKNVYLVPDIVLSLNNISTRQKREGCLLCFRSDCEKTLSYNEEEAIIDVLNSLFGNKIKYTNTVVNHSVEISHREKELMKKWNEFSSAKLVITDRLHGMIFSAITSTPCIVLPSKSKKILGCFELIKSLPYILYLSDYSELRQMINKLDLEKEYHYQPEKCNLNFNLIRHFILKICKE